MSLRLIVPRLAALFIFAVGAAPVGAADFIDAAGRRVILPDRISRAMAAGPTAEVLIFTLAPDKLVGWCQAPRRGFVPARLLRLQVVGRLTGPNPTAGAETVRRLRPDLIIDAGIVSPERAAFADQMQEQTGIPYILVDDSFARTPAMLRAIGAILGVEDRAADLALWAEHAIDALRGRLLTQPASNRPLVYYGRGPNGLETGLPGSRAGEAIDEAGAINVATPLGRGAMVTVTREQLRQWDPAVIIAQERSFYDALHRDPGWRNLAAVKSKRVYLSPEAPYGWIDEPPGVNRLIGLYWLSALLYPGGAQDDVRTLVYDFYQKFYRVTLTDGQIEAIARLAGLPPSDMPRVADLPTTGLGIPAPQVGPPGRGGAMPMTPMRTTPSYLVPK